MHLVIVGPPGAGKGTQAEKLSREFSLLHISTSYIFRNAVKEGTEMGRKAKEYMDKGTLVPDEIVIGIVRERLANPEVAGGVILDGFPRTLAQAEALDKVLQELGTDFQAVINVEVDEEELINRLTGRRVCRNCGTIYHIKFYPPKVRTICDYCGGELYQRSDDAIDTIKERLVIYKKKTQPMIEYYQRKGIIKNFDGAKKIDDVFADIKAYLESKKEG